MKAKKILSFLGCYLRKFGFLLARMQIVLVLTIIYFTVFAVIGVIKRVFSKDSFYQEKKRQASYWTIRKKMFETIPGSKRMF